MTPWADPSENPEQNPRYWREGKLRDWVIALVILAVFAGEMGWLVWQTHQIVSCIVDKVNGCP